MYHFIFNRILSLLLRHFHLFPILLTFFFSFQSGGVVPIDYKMSRGLDNDAAAPAAAAGGAAAPGGK